MENEKISPLSKKLSIWGISLNDDIAISDQPLQVFSEPPQEKHFSFRRREIHLLET